MLLRATPSVRHTAATGNRPPSITRSARATFFPGYLRRLFENLVLKSLLAQQPLQLTHLLLQSLELGGWNDGLIGSHGLQRSLARELAPPEQQTGGEPMLPGNQRNVHPRLEGLLHQALLLFSGKSASALHAEYLDLAGTRHCTISGHRSYSLGLCIRSVRSFKGLIQVHPDQAKRSQASGDPEFPLA